MQYTQSISNNIAVCIISHTGELDMLSYPCGLGTIPLIQQVLADCVIPVHCWDDIVIETSDVATQGAVSTALETIRNANKWRVEKKF